MGPGVVSTSLKNVYVVSADEVKTVCRNIDTKNKEKEFMDR